MSTANEDEARELMRLQAAEVRVYTPPSWLTRRYVTWVLLGMFTLGPVPAALFLTAGDQWLRNVVDEAMSDPDMYNLLSIDAGEYSQLRVHWRQVLAELSVRPEKAGTAELREWMKTLTPDQIALVDKIVPYVIDGFLVRDRASDSYHPIPGLSLVDFATLEDLGILQGVRAPYRRPNQPVGVPMTMSGRTAALKITRLTEEADVSLSVTRLTDMGQALVRLLRVPSEILYFEWVAKQIDQEGVDVKLFAMGPSAASSALIHRSTVAPWP
ncbi:MAG: hypothetical protein OXK79_01475 [Chloroflexota bacterium]|nr:hypothetical protein [Chloroflexota bacterium]